MKPHDRIKAALQYFIHYHYAANAGVPLSQFSRLDIRSYHFAPDLLDFTHKERLGIQQVLRAEIEKDGFYATQVFIKG